jgi:hypothetical protein
MTARRGGCRAASQNETEGNRIVKINSTMPNGMIGRRHDESACQAGILAAYHHVGTPDDVACPSPNMTGAGAVPTRRSA